jgi:hypothetical protein
MAYSIDDLKNASSWSVWCLQNTTMSKATIFRKARERFGVPAAKVERECRAFLGEDFWHERTEKQLELYRPNLAAKNSRTARGLTPYNKHFKDI